MESLTHCFVLVPLEPPQGKSGTHSIYQKC